jgi:spermidine synthase
MTHGIATTIVEIDPVVHDFATKYFDLPENHTPAIEDAVSFASRTAREGKKYDYIVHDVFTGGAEPVDLFTLEFIQDLYDMLEDWGVIALVSISHKILYIYTNALSRTTLVTSLFHPP